MPRNPYRQHKFIVEIGGFIRGGFQNVKGLSHKIEVIPYREGGDNDTERKLHGQSKYDPVTFERGVLDDSDMVNWIESASKLDGVNGRQPDPEALRRNITIYLLAVDGARAKRWALRNCWPSEHVFGDLDAMTNGVLTETLTVQHEGMKYTSLDQAS